MQNPVVLITLSIIISVLLAGIANILITRRYAGLISNKLQSQKKLQQQFDGLERKIDFLISEIKELNNSGLGYDYVASELDKLNNSSLRHDYVASEFKKLNSSSLEANEIVSQHINDTQNIVIKYIESKFVDNLHAQSSNLDKLYSRIESFHRLQNGFNDDTSQFGSLSGWAVYSDSLQLFIEKVGNKETILELGSGVSTFYLARLIKDRGFGKLISIEHDLDFYNILKEKLKNLKLDEHCTLLHCPLVDHLIDEEVYPWYDIKNVEALSEGKIDAMFVDGPPGNLRNCSRYPALPIMKEFLSGNSLVFLDDAKRKDEREIAEKWIKTYKLKDEMTYNSKGLRTLRFSDNQGG